MMTLFFFVLRRGTNTHLYYYQASILDLGDRIFGVCRLGGRRGTELKFLIHTLEMSLKSQNSKFVSFIHSQGILFM